MEKSVKVKSLVLIEDNVPHYISMLTLFMADTDTMGAPAIYHMPNRRKSACSLVSNNINGRTAPTNYEKYLKVCQGFS